MQPSNFHPSEQQQLQQQQQHQHQAQTAPELEAMHAIDEKCQHLTVSIHVESMTGRCHHVAAVADDATPLIMRKEKEDEKEVKEKEKAKTKEQQSNQQQQQNAQLQTNHSNQQQQPLDTQQHTQHAMPEQANHTQHYHQQEQAQHHHKEKKQKTHYQCSFSIVVISCLAVSTACIVGVCLLLMGRNIEASSLDPIDRSVFAACLQIGGLLCLTCGMVFAFGWRALARFNAYWNKPSSISSSPSSPLKCQSNEGVREVGAKEVGTQDTKGVGKEKSGNICSFLRSIFQAIYRARMNTGTRFLSLLIDLVRTD